MRGKSYDRDRLVKAIRSVWKCEEEQGFLMERETSRFKAWIQGMRKHGMFRKPNCMLFYLCNILYHIVERFSLICGCRDGWPNNVKTLWIFV